MNYQQSFGFEGRNMNKNYKEYSQVPSSISKFWNESREEKKLKGYYTWLEYIDERKLLFRVYKKGNHEVSNGLQVYDKNGTLIGDVNIPENFTQIIGYIEPYFYSNIFINPETWTMKIYRFTIEEI